jgi:hypothetical protein
MKAPRITLASIGMAILILAIDFAIVRAAFLSAGPEVWPFFALSSLLMIDVLLINHYRLRRRARRTAGAAGTIALFVACLIAPGRASDLVHAICRSVGLAGYRGLIRLLRYSTMQSRPMVLATVIVFEILLPVALFSAPPLIVAAIVGRLARRINWTGANSGVPVTSRA